MAVNSFLTFSVLLLTLEFSARTVLLPCVNYVLGLISSREQFTLVECGTSADSVHFEDGTPEMHSKTLLQFAVVLNNYPKPIDDALMFDVEISANSELLLFSFFISSLYPFTMCYSDALFILPTFSTLVRQVVCLPFEFPQVIVLIHDPALLTAYTFRLNWDMKANVRSVATF